VWLKKVEEEKKNGIEVEGRKREPKDLEGVA